MQQNNQNQAPKRKSNLLFSLFTIALIIGVIFMINQMIKPNPKTLTYAELVQAVQNKNVDTTTLIAEPAGGQNYDMFEVTGKVLDTDGKYITFYPLKMSSK